MRARGGVGIAAPQIGSFRRVIVAMVRLSTTQGAVPYVMVNPKMVDFEETTENDREACLSVPGKQGYVDRYAEIRVEYQDEEGMTREAILLGLEARVVQHEIDHLDGILFIDKVEL
jgi:peptide deformylase